MLELSNKVDAKNAAKHIVFVFRVLGSTLMLNHSSFKRIPKWRKSGSISFHGDFAPPLPIFFMPRAMISHVSDGTSLFNLVFIQGIQA